MIIDKIRTKIMLTKVLNDFTKDYNQVIYGINPFPPSEIQIKDYIDLWLERLFIENSLDDDE
jgi:hypothetical protein